MSAAWLIVAWVAAVCLTMRLASPLILGSRSSPTLARALEHAVPALLAALVITRTFAEGRRLTIDPRLAGVIAGGAVAVARKPALLVIIAAAGTTALLRAAGQPSFRGDLVIPRQVRVTARPEVAAEAPTRQS